MSYLVKRGNQYLAGNGSFGPKHDAHLFQYLRWAKDHAERHSGKVIEAATEKLLYIHETLKED